MTITETLTQASQGLLMPSESEYPFEVFVWENVELTPQKILELTNYPPGTFIEQVELDYFFRNVATEKTGTITSRKKMLQNFKIWFRLSKTI